MLKNIIFAIIVSITTCIVLFKILRIKIRDFTILSLLIIVIALSSLLASFVDMILNSIFKLF